MFIFEDTAINCWGSVDQSEKSPVTYVDGNKMASRRSAPKRDIRNSVFAFGNCRLGDRHILELAGKDAKLTAVDAKICQDRKFYGVSHPSWNIEKSRIQEFKSEFGSPYGDKCVALKAGESVQADVLCTDLSIAYADKVDGGVLKISVDGIEKLEQATNIPYKDISGKEHFIENRKGILNLGFGLHRVKITAEKAPVELLGLFSYDSRSNRKFERRLAGVAVPGETVEFSRPFKCRPFVICTGGLKAETDNISGEKVVFTGSSSGTYEAIGE